MIQSFERNAGRRRWFHREDVSYGWCSGSEIRFILAASASKRIF
jgi:hypothetical protein